jgi:hypothetical protein
MADASGFQEHWLNIEPERLARYETMYQWSTAAEAFYAPADIRQGHVVAPTSRSGHRRHSFRVGHRRQHCP